MKVIKDKEELSKIYKTVEIYFIDLVKDNHLDSKGLYEYVKSNLEEFVMDLNLSEVVGARRIILDVIEHLIHSEKDRIVR